MRKSEQKLWDRLRAALKDQVYLERVENVVNPGRPDVDVMWGGVTLPIELKAIETWPKKSTAPVLGKARGLNQNQLNWWLRWKQCGGSGFILISVGDAMFAVHATKADAINSFTAFALETWRTTFANFVWSIKEEVKCVRRL